MPLFLSTTPFSSGGQSGGPAAKTALATCRWLSSVHPQLACSWMSKIRTPKKSNKENTTTASTKFNNQKHSKNKNPPKKKQKMTGRSGLLFLILLISGICSRTKRCCENIYIFKETIAKTSGYQNIPGYTLWFVLII